jgi:hypothetical protein
MKKRLLRSISLKLDAVLLALDDLKQRDVSMSAELDALTNQVKANTDAEASAVLLLGQLSALIKAAAADPAKLQALATDLDASKQALAAAILANTPK